MAVQTGNVTGASGSTAAATAAGQASQDAAVNFDTFLKLLSVQLQNQDPLNPMDGTAFTEQMATFSGLEQQIATNKHLEGMAAKTDLTAQQLATSYIGKDAMVQGSDISLSGETVSFALALEDNAKTAQLEIIDASTGQVVRSVNLETRTKGVQYFNWDGQNDTGQELSHGAYKLRLSAYGDDEKKIVSETYTYGRVVSVEGDANNITVVLNDGREADVDEVFGVREASTIGGPDAPTQSLAVGYIGKEVMINGDKVDSNGTGAPIGVAVPAGAGGIVKLAIEDADGNQVRVIELEDPAVGQVNHINWDGQDGAGNVLASGEYKVKAFMEVESEEGGTTNLNLSTYTFGKVSSVVGNATSSQLKLVDGRITDIYGIQGVRNGS